MFRFGAFLLLLVSLSQNAFAEENAHKFNFFSKTYGSAVSQNVYYWSSDFKTKLQSQIPTATKEDSKKNSIGERIAAVGLSLLVEFTTSQSFNDIEVK